MLESIQGRRHSVYSGIVFWDRGKKLLRKRCAVTQVWIKKMTSDEIRCYMKRVHPLDKAGSYGIQEGPRIVTKIRGSYSNVVGLPVEILKSWLSGLR
jgi:septum formation protein